MEFTGYLEGLFFQRIGLVHWWQKLIVKHKIQIWLALHLRGLGLKLLPIYIYKKVKRKAPVGSFKKYLSEVKFSVQRLVEYQKWSVANFKQKHRLNQLYT